MEFIAESGGVVNMAAGGKLAHCVVFGRVESAIILIGRLLS